MNEQPLPITELREKLIPAKSYLKSKTVWGLIIIVGLTVARYFGYDVEAEANKSGELLNTFGWVLTLLGLRTAKQPLQFFSGNGVGNGVNMLIISVCVVGTALGLGGLVSCSAVSGIDVRVTNDGCVLAGKSTAKGGQYYAGICADGRFVARWDQRQADGSLKEIRYTRFPDGKIDIEYRDGNLWLGWDDKSGVTVGEIPVTSVEQLALPRRGVDHAPPIVSADAEIVPAK